MPFKKNFFERISHILNMYFKVFPCGVVTVTLKAYGKQYNLHRTLSVDEDTITFIYYDDEKSVKMPEQKIEPTTAWPALTLPYEVVEFVEFNPGKAGTEKTTMGFKLSN